MLVYLKGDPKWSIGYIYPWGYEGNELWPDNRQIGYGFIGEYQGYGYCTEAVLGVLEYIPVEYRRIVISGPNWKSQNVAAKCGFYLVKMDNMRSVWERPELFERHRRCLIQE